MDYIKGKNLSEIIRKGEGKKAMIGKKLYSLLIRALIRVQQLNKIGYTHRDIKRQNFYYE